MVGYEHDALWNGDKERKLQNRNIKCNVNILNILTKTQLSSLISE